LFGINPYSIMAMGAAWLITIGATTGVVRHYTAAAYEARIATDALARSEAARVEEWRRADLVAKAQKDARALADQLAEANQARADVQKEIDNASQSGDGNACLDAAGVVRLNKIGVNRRKADSSAR
jgi:seryl-tRNA synthetase